MIPRDFIDTLLARVDIVDVIDRRVPLKKAGQNYQACCPFHSEKSPSFTVSPTKQFYHCFGCGAHGTALGFLMEYEHMSFPDAVAALAQDVGLAVPEAAGETSRPKPPPALWNALEEAAQFYRRQLKQAPHAIDYLKRRGLTGVIAARYGIGYAPDGSPLKQVFSDYAAETLTTSGLVVDGDNGRRYDRFRNRIMFPIRNVKGQITGFGGRVLDQGEPKYLNSPETPLFHKGSEIYGLYEARAAIKTAGRVIVVEGYMDVVALAQHGVEFAVATLGTATTPIHARTLLRHSDRLIYAFDGDNAGRKAAWRALENSLEALQDGKEVGFLFLPEGEDPDSYIRANGQTAFLQLLDTGTVPLSEFLVRELARDRNLATHEGQAAFLNDAKPLLAKISAPILARLIERQIAEAARLPAEALPHIGLKAAPPQQTRPRASSRPPRREAPSSLRNAAQALVMLPHRAIEIETRWLEIDDPLSAPLQAFVAWLSSTQTSATPAALREAVRGSEFEPFVDELMTGLLDKADDWDWEAHFEHAVAQLRESWRQRRRLALSARALDSLSESERSELSELARS